MTESTSRGGAGRPGASDPVGQLQRDVDELTAYSQHQVGELWNELALRGPRINDQASELAEHTSTLADLRSDVNDLLAEQPPSAKYPPICWPLLTANEVAREWDNLALWVREVLVGWYHPSRKDLPDCWPLHPGALTELSALERLWQQAYTSRSPGTAAAEWHTRWRPDLLAGVARAIAREAATAPGGRPACGPGTHLGQYLPGAEPQTSTHPQQREATTQGWPEQAVEQPAAPGMPARKHPGALAAMASPPSTTRRRDTSGSVDVRNEADDLAEARFWWPHYQTTRDQMAAARRAHDQPSDE